MLKTHKELADFITGKKILHLNSFGKDSALCLEWLNAYTHTDVVSINFTFTAPHPKDETYLRYQKRKYPQTQFIQDINVFELNKIMRGIYQTPIKTLTELNKCEYERFDFWLFVEELRKKYNCDYVCIGYSKYESVTRASQMYKNGLVQGEKIFPLGMMTKDQVISLIEATGIKLHPVYKFCESTLDFPSYYKMRSTFITSKEYYKQMTDTFPLIKLDKYRYEKLIKKN